MVSGPVFSDSEPFEVITPKVHTLNPKKAESLTRIINHYWDEGVYDLEVDFKNVKILTNVAARMICKAIYGRDSIIIKNTNEAVFSSLDWAADYLYRKGELDTIPWQFTEMEF